jgi:hypothetical protein
MPFADAALSSYLPRVSVQVIVHENEKYQGNRSEFLSSEQNNLQKNNCSSSGTFQ